MRTVEGVKYYRTKDKRWLHELDVGLAVAPATFPEAAEKGQKWVEISIGNQTLVLWEGKRPIYVTLISSGKAGLDDPKKTTATIRGVFRIRNKHITATMDSNEQSSVGGRADTVARMDGGDSEEKAEPAKSPAKEPTKTAQKGKPSAPAKDGKQKSGSKKDAGTKLAAGGHARDAGSGGSVKTSGNKPSSAKAKNAPSKEAGAVEEKGETDYVPRKGDGMYGVTRRRGEGTFQLRDVPYIQYFESGYALHAAYWHDVFGTPRSHGCVNLSPIDAHRIFMWTDPAVPEGWHAMNTGDEMGEGTVVIVHE